MTETADSYSEPTAPTRVVHRPAKRGSGQDAARRRISEAIDRLLAGTPQRARSGRLSVLALAKEARVERNTLNRQYSDLRDKFTDLVRVRTATRAPSPPDETTTPTPQQLLHPEAATPPQSSASMLEPGALRRRRGPEPKYPDTDPVRQAITEAIPRLLTGTPQHIEAGRLSVRALAEEAQVERSLMNLRYPDLCDLFSQLIRAGEISGTPATTREARLLRERDAANAELAELREKYTDKRKDRNLWKDMAETFVRHTQTLNVELRHEQSRVQTLTNQRDRIQTRLADVEQLLRELQTGPATPNAPTLRSVLTHWPSPAGSSAAPPE